MKTMRKGKLSLIVKIASVLACFAIASVGFASWWIINYPEAKEYSAGSFNAYTVSEKEITFGDVTAVGNANIVFGTPASTSTTTKWLGSNDVATENLTAVLMFDVTLDSNDGDALNTYLSTVDVKFNAGDVYAGLVGNTYVAAPVVSYKIDDGEYTAVVDNNTDDGNDFTFSIAAPDTKTATVYLKFDFGWGEATEGKNPYDYFNGQTYTAQLAEQAKTMLEAIGGVAQPDGTVIGGINNNTYSVHISATPKN